MADVASLVFDIDSSQARGAAKVLQDLNAVVIKTANDMAKFDKTMRDSSGRFMSTSKYLSDNADEVERLARAYNPLLAAQIQYRDEVIRTAAAVKAGVITEDQRVDILTRTKANLDAASGASSRFGKSQDVARHHVANLSFQLNDISMMMASGQSPFMLMIQQGPQVAQILGQMRQEGSKIGPTLAGAFRMVLNPTTLLTLALIGGTAALSQWIFKSGDADKKAKTLEDSLGNLNDAISSLQKNNKLLSGTSGLDDMVEKYGKATQQIRNMIAAQRDLDMLSAQKEQADMQAKLAASIEPGFLARAFDNGRIAITAAEREADKLQKTTKYLTDTLHVTDASAKGLAQTLIMAFNEKDPAKYANLVGHVRDYLLQVASAGGKGADAARKMAEDLTASEEASRRAAFSIDAATGSTNQWAGAMSGVNSQIQNIARSLAAISGLQIDAASAKVEKRLLEMGVKTGEAAKRAMDTATAAGFNQRRSQLISGFSGNYNSPEYKTAIRLLNEEQQAAKAAANAQYNLGIARDFASKAEREENKPGSGGASAATKRAESEMKAAEKGFQSLRELMEKEGLFQFAEYEKRQQQLEVALQKKLVTEQQHEEMSRQLRTMYFGTEFEQRALQQSQDVEQLRSYLAQKLITEQEYYDRRKQMRWEDLLFEGNRTQRAQDLSNTAQYFGQLQSLTGSNNSTLLRMQQSFQAASALLNAYTAASQVLADQTAPWYMKLAAAGKVLAAGIGFAKAIKGGGSGGGGGSSAPSAPAARPEPTKSVLVRLEGPDWMQDMADDILTQIYEQSKDGRVIIARDR